MTDFTSDLAALTKLSEIAAAHPDLPDLVSLQFDDQGMHAVPWLHLRPVTALVNWVDALPGRWTVHAEPATIGDGTQLTARGTLAGMALALTVVTWRVEIVARADGLVTREQLRHLAAQETVSSPAAEAADEAAPAPAVAPA